ncbi:MAG: hypothetical protein KDA84_28710, partial [Planctomycetaceae bacterium]|nr:hypothetical protein [Planctomycetaceae bacterium]
MSGDPSNSEDAELTIPDPNSPNPSDKSTGKDNSPIETTILYPGLGDDFDSPIPHPSESPTRDLQNVANRWIGDYELIEELGRGGMG